MAKLSLRDIIIQKYNSLNPVVIYEPEGEKSEIKIGRASSNDIAIPKAGYRDEAIDKVVLTMSREHCTVKYDGNFTVYDKVGKKKSKHGTYVNGVKVPETGVVLKNNDKLMLGSYELEVILSDEELQLAPADKKVLMHN